MWRRLETSANFRSSINKKLFQSPQLRLFSCSLQIGRQSKQMTFISYVTRMIYTCITRVARVIVFCCVLLYLEIRRILFFDKYKNKKNSCTPLSDCRITTKPFLAQNSRLLFSLILEKKFSILTFSASFRSGMSQQSFLLVMVVNFFIFPLFPDLPNFDVRR